MNSVSRVTSEGNDIVFPKQFGFPNKSRTEKLRGTPRGFANEEKSRAKKREVEGEWQV